MSMPAMCNSIGRWHYILQNEGLINLLLQLGTPCCHYSADGNKTQSKVTLRDIKIPLCGNFRILLLNPLQMLASLHHFVILAECNCFQSACMKSPGILRLCNKIQFIYLSISRQVTECDI